MWGNGSHFQHSCYFIAGFPRLISSGKSKQLDNRRDLGLCNIDGCGTATQV